MVRDLRRDEDHARAAMDVVAHVAADAILLLDVDRDAGGADVAALRAALAARELDYAHAVALPVNAGIPTGRDLDGDGTAHEARDAKGYGRFTGDGGMVLLSRWPVAAESFTDVPWDHALAPPGAGVPVPTVAQWVVTLDGPWGPVTWVTLAAGTPVFDGPEDRNGLRNRDELALAARLVDAAPGPVVAIGRTNVDPRDGQGRRDGLMLLTDHPRLRDPAPRGAGGGGAGHAGDPALDTADWEGPGPLRVDMALVDRSLRVRDAGVVWPVEGPLAETVAAAGPGRAVWVDLLAAARGDLAEAGDGG